MCSCTPPFGRRAALVFRLPLTFEINAKPAMEKKRRRAIKVKKGRKEKLVKKDARALCAHPQTCKRWPFKVRCVSPSDSPTGHMSTSLDFLSTTYTWCSALFNSIPWRHCVSPFLSYRRFKSYITIRFIIFLFQPSFFFFFFYCSALLFRRCD